MKAIPLVTIAASIALVAISPAVVAQLPRGQADHGENVRHTVALRNRIKAAEAGIAAAGHDGRLPRARADALQHKIVETRASMGALSRRQGFLSAAELASYDRTLDAVEAELGNGGSVPHLRR